MADRVRVRNTTKFDIGVVTINGIEYNIKAGLFILMNRDDVEYNMALAPKLFREPSMLVVEDDELSLNMGIEDYNKAAMTDDEVVKALKGTVPKLKAFLAEHKGEKHVMQTVWDLAKDMDLPASKIKALGEAFPDREFIE